MFLTIKTLKYITIMMIAIAFSGFLLLSYEYDIKKLNILSGELDLEDWNSNTLATLDGEWRFYPNTFKENMIGPGTIHTVPHIWDNSIESDTSYHLHGTYTLLITGLIPNHIYGVYLVDAGTSYRLTVNNEVVMSNGVLGSSFETQTPEQKAATGYFQTDSNGEAFFVMEISNYHNHRGGFWLPLTIGNQQIISNYYTRNIIVETALFGWFIAIGAINLLIFFLSKKEKGALYLGLATELIAARIMLTGHRIILTMIPNLPWIWVEKSTYLLGMLLVPTSALLLIYFRFVQPRKWMKIVLSTISTFVILYPLIMEVDYFRVGYTIFQYVTIGVLLFMFIQISIAAIHKLERAIFILLTLTFLILSVVFEFFFGSPVYYLFFTMFVASSAFTIIIIDEFLTTKAKKQTLENNIIKDPLTQVYNRLYLDQLIRGEICITKTTQKSYIIFFDINQFKRFNDEHGHLVGDQILIQTAAKCEALIGNQGTIIRYGGDEFLIILHIEDSTTIDAWIDKLEKVIHEPLTYEGKTYQVSGFFGYILYDLSKENLEKSIRLSDEDMYLKKTANAR